MIAQPIEELRRLYGAGPMSDDELELLQDVQAFIEFGIRNGLSFAAVLGRLSHDVNGLSRYGFDLDAARRDAFQPQASGYSQIDEESVGEAEETQRVDQE